MDIFNRARAANLAGGLLLTAPAFAGTCELPSGGWQVNPANGHW